MEIKTACHVSLIRKEEVHLTLGSQRSQRLLVVFVVGIRAPFGMDCRTGTCQFNGEEELLMKYS